MSDQRRRRAERDAAGGEPAARARLLVERLRLGELQREALELAAYLGHSPARSALGSGAPRAQGELAERLEGLEPWGPEPLLRAAGVALRAFGKPGSLSRALAHALDDDLTGGERVDLTRIVSMSRPRARGIADALAVAIRKSAAR